jgi:hypothetical protein
VDSERTIQGNSACRYFFKIVNLPTQNDPEDADGNENLDVYIVAKSEMDCDDDSSGKQLQTPGLLEDDRNMTKLFSSQQLMEQIREEEKKQGSREHYTTPIILFLFIALPTVTCLLSLIFNIPMLPCGLCNMFRRPSYAFLRNVRPYPGPMQDLERSTGDL